jgi:hypothetical protein
MAMAAREQSDAERGRALVQWYFSERGGPTGSVAEIFSGKGRHQRESGLKPSRRVDGLSPTRVHAVETRKPGVSRAPEASGRGGGSVRRAIAGLSPIHQSWVQFEYGTNLAVIRAAADQLRRLVPNRLAQYHPELSRANARTVARVALMLDDRLRGQHWYWTLSAEPGKAAPPYLEADGVSDEAWRKTYRPIWRQISAQLRAVDTEAMEQVWDSTQQRS